MLKAPLLTLLGTDTNTYSHASDYYTYIALGAPFILACNTPMNLLRAEGLATASMIGSIAGSITNIILDPIFILGFDMGAAGAALGTMLTEVMVLTIQMLMIGKDIFQYIDGVDLLKSILAVGIGTFSLFVINS